MNMTRPFATAAALALMTSFGVSAVSASTMTIMIDDFTVDQSVRADGGPTSGVAVDPTGNSILGGVRFMQVATDPSPGPGSGTTLDAFQGVLEFGNLAGQLGTGWLVYDGTEDRTSPAVNNIDYVNGVALGVGVNTTGMGPFDFLMGMPDGFFTFSVLGFDNDFLNQPAGTLEFSAFAWDALGGAVSYFEPIDPADFSERLYYSEFSGTPFDWSQVSALAFRIQSFGVRGLDGQIGAITATPIPLPAAAFLLLGGLGGLAGISFVGKRRRKN